MTHNPPPPSSEQNYITVAPINGGVITLPERSCFSERPKSSGLRAQLHNYIKEQRSHLESRVPYQFGPGVAQSLRNGDLDPSDIDTVILSHVHYGHHGDPADFPSAQFLLGSGSLALVKHGLGLSASHQVFDPNLFRDVLRVNKLPNPTTPLWKPLGPFEATFDLLNDGSI